MPFQIRLIINKFFTNPNKLFMIDGSGALLTAFILITILTRFESVFGMPLTVLYFLSAIACLYAIYSFCCYFFIFSNWMPYLKAIVIANSIYCCLTIGLLFYFCQSLTIFGFIYFSLEITVITCLIAIERMVLLSKKI